MFVIFDILGSIKPVVPYWSTIHLNAERWNIYCVLDSGTWYITFNIRFFFKYRVIDDAISNGGSDNNMIAWKEPWRTLYHPLDINMGLYFYCGTVKNSCIGMWYIHIYSSWLFPWQYRVSGVTVQDVLKMTGTKPQQETNNQARTICTLIRLKCGIES